VIGLVIAVTSLAVVNVLAVDYDTEHEVLAGTLDMNWGFTVTPVKVLITLENRPALVALLVDNKSNEVTHFEIRQEEAWKLTDGLKHWDGSMKMRFPETITVKPQSMEEVQVIIDRSKATEDQEVWLMIKRVSEDNLRHEVAVRLLVELDK